MNEAVGSPLPNREPLFGKHPVGGFDLGGTVNEAVGSPLDLSPIRERAENATRGPWVPFAGVVTTEELGVDICVDAYQHLPPSDWPEHQTQWQRDAEFIAHARTDIDSLLAALVSEREETQKLREVAEAWKAVAAIADKIAPIDHVILTEPCPGPGCTDRYTHSRIYPLVLPEGNPK